MTQSEAVELANWVGRSCRKRALPTKLGNGEWVVILTQSHYFLWCPEDWSQFLAR